MYKASSNDVKHFDSNKTISFNIIDEKLLKKVYQNMEMSQQFNEY